MQGRISGKIYPYLINIAAVILSRIPFNWQIPSDKSNTQLDRDAQRNLGGGGKTVRLSKTITTIISLTLFKVFHAFGGSFINNKTIFALQIVDVSILCTNRFDLF